MWNRVEGKAANLAVYNVKVTNHDGISLIDGMHSSAIVVPDDISRIHSPHVIHLGEMCSGAFAGWVHAQSVCCCLDLDIRNVFAVEMDHEICDVYCKSWQNAVKVNCIGEYLESLQSCKYLIFSTDVEQGWWMTCIAHKAIDILAFSPPCQPWSEAGLGKGLNTNDGWTMVSGFVAASVLRPKTMVLEQVASIRRHIHWTLLLRVIEKCGYKIIEERVVNMNSISPQNRERLLLVLMRSDESFQHDHLPCEFPNIGLQSLMAFNAIQHDLGTFAEYVKISQAVLEKYLDYKFLPTMRSDKKRKVDVMTYRIRQTHDSVGCIMASYGSQHEFSDDKLLGKGLFGNLLQCGDQIRFFSGAEVLILMMPCQSVFVPKNLKLHMKIIGNGITSAHAIFALSFAIRALGFVDSPCAKPSLIVIETLKRRLHFGNLIIRDFADGWWIAKKSDAIIDIPMNVAISPTIRDDRFQKVKLFAGQWNLSGFAEQSIDARDLIRCFGVNEDFIVQIHQTSDTLIIRLRQPLVLPLLLINWNDTKSKLVTIVMQETFVITHRVFDVTVAELQETLVHQGTSQHGRSFLTNMLGMVLQGYEKPPPLVMLIPSCILMNIRWTGELPKFTTASGNISTKCLTEDAIRLACLIKSRGISNMCAIFGWFIQIERGPHDDILTVISFVRQTLGFVITTEVFQSMFAIWNIQMLLPPNRRPITDDLQVCIKYYGLRVWDGFVNKGTTVGNINHSWNTSLAAFGIDCPVKCVIQGRNRTDEFSLNDHVGDTANFIQIHWVLPTHGGGAKDDQKFVALSKFATILLSRGIAVGETADYAQKVASNISSGKLLHELSTYEKSKNWDKLKEWLKGMGFPIPNPNPSIEKAVTKIQQAIRRKKNFPIYQVKADDFQICPDHFRKCDGTPAIVLSSLLGAKTGVILMDADDAKPWLSKPGPIVSESLACIVVGHQCPCVEKHKCRKITLPVHDKQGNPSVIAGCLHQLGDKDVELPKDHVSKVAVVKSTVCGFTVFRDECDCELWDMILESPVKSVLKLLAADVSEGFLATSPWGRSWKNDRAVCSPSEASSFQFHARIKEDRLKEVMTASGSGPIYITPKDENKGLLKGWAVIWMKGSKNEVLITITASDIRHHGLVRTIKGLGLRVLQKDFESSFKKLRPHDRIPTSIPATYLYKLQPLPVGLTADVVEQFTKDQGWPTRALRALGHDTWLIAAETVCDKTWLRLNEQVVLVKPIQPTSQKPKPIVLAGATPQASVKESEQVKTADPWSQDKNDPWMKYKPISGMQTPSQASSSSVGNHQLTLQDPSLAKKLHEQDTQIKTLQKTVEDLHTMQQKVEDATNSMQQDMDNKFQKMRSEVTNQMGVLSNQFQHSLTQALAKQDKQITNGFDEIKALFASNQTELTAKKPRTLPKGKGKQNEQPEDEDTHMGASPLRST